MEFLMQPIRGTREYGAASVAGTPVAGPGCGGAGAVEGGGMVTEHPVLEQVVLELARAVGSADAQILAAGEAAAERGHSSPAASKLSTGKMNPRAPGWNKRISALILGLWPVHLIWIY